MKFRIKYIEGLGYWAQVKIKLSWYRIGLHISGFGLYSENDNDYPLKTRDEAIEQCEKFVKWYNLKEAKPSYEYIDELFQ